MLPASSSNREDRYRDAIESVPVQDLHDFIVDAEVYAILWDADDKCTDGDTVARSVFSVNGGDSIVLTSDDESIIDYDAIFSGPVPFPQDPIVDYCTYVSFLSGITGHSVQDANVVYTIIEEKIVALVDEVLESMYSIQELCFWIAINRECLQVSVPSLPRIKASAEALIRVVASKYEDIYGHDGDFDGDEYKDRLQALVMNELRLLLTDLRQFISTTVLESSI